MSAGITIDNRTYHLRPASPEEAGLFYALPPEEDEALGAIGHVRIDFGHGGTIEGGWVQSCGYIVETEHYRYCLRCDPMQGDYQCCLNCLDKRAQEMRQEHPSTQNIKMGGMQR